MRQKKVILLPKVERILAEFGENIKLARRRRKLKTEQVAERAGITRTTLWAIEKGSPKVALGYYAQVLFVLGLDKNLLAVASNDELGRRLQDAKLLSRQTKRKSDGTEK